MSETVSHDAAWRHERAVKAARARSGPEYHVAKIKQIVDESRAEQNLPEHVTDGLVLARVAAILNAASDDDGGR